MSTYSSAAKPCAASMTTGWSILPQDLIIIITNRLDFFEDFVAFGKVCKPWRSVATIENFTGLLPQRYPSLLIIEQGSNSFNPQVYNLRKGKFHEQNRLPEAKNEQFCYYYSSRGWLLSISETNDVALLHPSHHRRIELPNLDGVLYRRSSAKFALSSSPSRTSDYIVMVTYNDKLVFWRPGEDEWTSVMSTRSIIDLNYCLGQFYAVDSDGGILVCDIENTTQAKTRIIASRMPYVDHYRWSCRRHRHLVESQGALLLVCWPDTEYLMHVFEVPLNNDDWSGSRVINLGNTAILIGPYSSTFSIKAYDDSGCKPNCIYFANHDDKKNNLQMSTFDMFDGKFRSKLIINGMPLWIQPGY